MTELVAHRRILAAAAGVLICVSGFAQAIGVSDVGTTGVVNDPNVALIDRGDGSYALVFTNAQATTFTFSRPFVVTEALLVGGGGAGGGNCGGGGGAGGFVHVENLEVGIGIGEAISVTVGVGGTVPSKNAHGDNGGDSVLTMGASDYRAIGGGGGGTWDSKAGNAGGSGGGGITDGGATTQAASGLGIGFAGAAGSDGNRGGGGGGAGGAGLAPMNNHCGDGGPGVSCSITGSPVVYAAGGGGASRGVDPGAGGSDGVGGKGGDLSVTTEHGKGCGCPGKDGTGSGGGGSASDSAGFGGDGGSGIVVLVIRPDTSVTIAVLPHGEPGMNYFKLDLTPSSDGGDGTGAVSLRGGWSLDAANIPDNEIAASVPVLTAYPLTVTGLVSGKTYYYSFYSQNSQGEKSAVAKGQVVLKSEAAGGEPGVGGAVTKLANGDAVHVFTESGTLVLSEDYGSARVLIVGGGGSGGGNCGGGGGAGGFVELSEVNLTAGSYAVTVGAGGAKGSQNANGVNGEDSTFAVGDVVYCAVGGGGGAAWSSHNAVVGLSGGSGGGSIKTDGAASVQSEKGYGLGNVGGSSTASNFGGGGGGADGAGGAAGSVGGAGGLGKESDITGEPVFYAAGGGGGGAGTPGAGGSGIGGNGGGQDDSSQGGKGWGYPGKDGTGSGGGGSAGGSGIGGYGGAGGSGVVIVRYHYAKDISEQLEPSVSFGLGTLSGNVVTIPYAITWPGKGKAACSAKILYGFAADDLRYEQNLGANRIGDETATLGDLIPGRHYCLKLVVSNGDHSVESEVMDFDVASSAPAPSAYPVGMPVIAGDGSGCVTIAGENVTFAGTFAQYVEGTVVKFHYLDDETWREVTATSVGADGFSGSFTIMTTGARYPYYYLTAEATTGSDRTPRKSFIVGGSVTLSKTVSVSSPNCEITVTGSLENYESEDAVTVTLMIKLGGVWTPCGSTELQQAGAFAITYDGTGKLVCGESYDAKLTLANQESDIVAFMVPDTLTYTWRNRDGARSWDDPDNWEPSDLTVLGAGYPVLGSTARFASGTATVENAAVSIAKLSLADGATLRLGGASTSLALGSAQVESGRATLLFEIPEKGYAEAPIRNLADAPKFNAEGGSLALAVDRASPFFARHLTAWRTQTLVDWSTGLNTSALSFDRGDVTAMGGEKANALVRPMATADSVRKIAVELRGSAPTVVALSKNTQTSDPGEEEEEDIPSWVDDPTPDEELSWSEASETAAKKYNTCVILATSDDAAAGLWRTRLNEAGVAVARVKGDFTGENAGAAGQRAVRVARAAANAGLHGLSSGAKIGAVGIEEGARLALLMALSSKDTFYTPKDATDELSCKMDFAGVVSPCDCIDGGVGNIVLNDKDEPTVDGVYANLAPEFKFDGDKCPIATISGDRQFVDPKSTYWTASLIYRRIRERTGVLNHLKAQAHFYGAKEKPGNRVKRMLEFMKSSLALGSLGTKSSASSLYPGGERDPVYHDPDLYEKTYLWNTEIGSPIDPETGKGYTFSDTTKIPYIEWYVPTNLTTRAIQIIYSGGSYGTSQPGSSEVKPARICLNMHGMTVVTLHYRATGGSTNGYIRSQQDLQRAIRLVRAKAPSLGLDPNRIGIMGSSAGGHMTLYHATKSLENAYQRIDDIDDYPATVKWAIPVYPAYTVGGGYRDGESENGLDPIRSQNRFLYDEATPAFLFMHGDVDGWPAGGSVKVWEALHRHGFEAELHTFADAEHCFQDNIYPDTSAYHYMDIVWEFLTTHKFNIW